MSTVTVSLAVGARTLTLETPAGGVIHRSWRGGRWYEAPLLAHFRGLHLRGLAVDAGANVGNHTVYLAAVCGLRVAAFEPVQAALLRRNVARNGLARAVTVYDVALGRTPAAAAHIGRGELRVGAGAITVRPLDSFGFTGVTLIKADVEGMEPDVLAGGEATIRRDRPVIFAEVWPGHEAALAAVLTPWGYHRVRRFHGRLGTPTPVEEWRCE